MPRAPRRWRIDIAGVVLLLGCGFAHRCCAQAAAADITSVIQTPQVERPQRFGALAPGGTSGQSQASVADSSQAGGRCPACGNPSYISMDRLPAIMSTNLSDPVSTRLRSDFSAASSDFPTIANSQRSDLSAQSSGAAERFAGQRSGGRQSGGQRLSASRSVRRKGTAMPATAIAEEGGTPAGRAAAGGFRRARMDVAVRRAQHTAALKPAARYQTPFPSTVGQPVGMNLDTNEEPLLEGTGSARIGGFGNLRGFHPSGQAAD